MTLKMRNGFKCLSLTEIRVQVKPQYVRLLDCFALECYLSAVQQIHIAQNFI